MAAPTSRKELQEAWILLRLSLREAASAYNSPFAARIAALPASPPDPKLVEPLARRLVEEMTTEAGKGELSPTIRLLKKTFRPNDAEKKRRNIEKTFNAYLRLWQDRTTG